MRWFEPLLVAAIVGLVWLPGLGEVEFHGDESQWIHTSRFLEHALAGDSQADVWRVHYWTLTQPPMVRYTIGISRRAGGFEMVDLNKPYRFGVRRAANERQGRIPSPELLWWSRLAMVVEAAVALGVVFLLVAWAAGRLAGYLSVLVVLVNPYFAEHLRRAMGEASVLFWSVVTALIACVTLSRLRSGGRLRAALLLVGSVAAGVTAGLAGASKLNGLAAIGVGSMIGVGMLLSSSLRSWRAIASIVVVVALSCATFVVVNPFLYSSPIERTKAMFENRQREVRNQLRGNPEDRMIDLEQRARTVQERILRTHAPWRFPRSGLVNLVLVLAGALWLAFRTRLLWRQAQGGEAPLVVLTSALLLGAPIALSPLDWARYYLFPVLFGSVLLAIAIARGVGLLLGTARTD